jgi:sugar-phosphatase
LGPMGHEFGVVLAAPLKVLHGPPASATVRRLLPQQPDRWERAAARQYELQYDDLGGVSPSPGARDFIAQLDALELPWAVVTSADRRLASLRLTAAGLVAPLVVAAEDAPRGKPEPDPYRVAATMLKVDVRTCLVVEDTSVGADSGRRAGAVVAGLRGIVCDGPIRNLMALSQIFAAAARRRQVHLRAADVD